MVWPASLLCSLLIAQAPGLSPETLLISRAIRHNRQILSRTSDYTCLETIDRSEQKLAGRAFRRVDLIRVEVARVGDKELFSWPGGQFEEKPLSDFAGGGLMGDGTFSSFSDDLFVNNATSMTVRGPENLMGRSAVRIDYVVSPLRSKFTLRTASGHAEVNYSGSYWVDPETLDILRLDIQVSEIPSHLGLAKAGVRIEYARIQAGGAVVVLAQHSAIELTMLSGEIHRNEIDFTQCRKFAGDAKIVADTGNATSGPTENSLLKPLLQMPAGLTIPLRLNDPIDPARAAVGDPLAATVESEVRDRRRVWLEKGAVVHGRIRRLEQREGTLPYVLIGVEFTAVETGTDRLQFTARLDSISSAPGVQSDHREVQRDRRISQPNGVGSGGTITSTVAETYDNPLPGVGYLYLTAPPFRVSENLRMTWKTEPLSGAPVRETAR